MPSQHCAARLARVVLFSTVIGMAGCAGLTTVVGDVSSFARSPTEIRAGSYRFERLPSQEQDPSQAAALEGMAQKALEKAGFKRADNGPVQYSVQVDAWTSEAVEVWPEPRMGRWGWPSRFDHLRPWGLRPALYGPWPDRQVYLTKVRVDIRDLASNMVVYETSATNEQNWFVAEQVLPALFEAALSGFPQALPTVHAVSIVLPKN